MWRRSRRRGAAVPMTRSTPSNPHCWGWRVPGRRKTCRTRFGSGATPSTTPSTAMAPTARASPSGNGSGGSVDYAKSIDGIGLGRMTLEPEGADIFKRALQRAYEQLRGADDPRTPDPTARRRAGRDRPHLPRGQALQREPPAHARPHRPRDAARRPDRGMPPRRRHPHISPDTARRIACDAVFQELVVDHTGVPLWLGRSTRTFTPDQFRAMVARDGGCRCCRASPEHCDAHHVTEWNNQGSTDIDNGMLLCRYGCHRGMHEGHWKVVGNPNGRLQFSDRNGNHIATSEPRPARRTRPHQTRPPAHPARHTHPHTHRHAQTRRLAPTFQ